MNDIESRSIVSLIHMLQSFGWVDISNDVVSTELTLNEDGVPDLEDASDNIFVISYDLKYEGKLTDYEEMYHLWDSLLDAHGFIGGKKKFGEDIVCFYNWGFEPEST